MTERASTPPGSPLDAWESSTWEGHARWQLQRTLAATPLDRLLWLEEAIQLAWRSGALRGRTGEPGGPVEADDAGASV